MRINRAAIAIGAALALAFGAAPFTANAEGETEPSTPPEAVTPQPYPSDYILPAIPSPPVNVPPSTMPDRSDEPPRPVPSYSSEDAILPKPVIPPLTAVLLTATEMMAFQKWSEATGIWGDELDRTADGLRLRPMGQEEWILLGRFAGVPLPSRSVDHTVEPPPAAGVSVSLPAPPTTGIRFEATNASPRFARVTVRWSDGVDEVETSRVLSPRETWRSALDMPLTRNNSAERDRITAKSVPLSEIFTTDHDSRTLRFSAYASTTVRVPPPAPVTRSPKFR